MSTKARQVSVNRPAGAAVNRRRTGLVDQYCVPLARRLRPLGRRLLLAAAIGLFVLDLWDVLILYTNDPRRYGGKKP